MLCVHPVPAELFCCVLLTHDVCLQLCIKNNFFICRSVIEVSVWMCVVKRFQITIPHTVFL